MIETLLHALREALAHNQLVQGGFVLAAVGGALAYLHRLPSAGWRFCVGRAIVTVEVTNNDPLFDWLTFWLAAHPYSKRVRNLVATSVDLPNANGSTTDAMAPAGSSQSTRERRSRIVLTPAPGTHLMRHGRTLMWVTRDRNEPKDNKNGGGWFRQETYRVRMFAKHRDAALGLLEEAHALSVSQKPTRTDIYVGSYDYWHQADSRNPRPVSSVFLPRGVAESVVEDVQTFIRSRDWYARRGVPYRRGYLFHGVPGSGKTSLILALAGELRLDLYILNLSGTGHTDASLPQLLSRVPSHSALLVEDVDAAFAGRESREGAELSFAGFLNALDGAASREGWIVFMTTNRKSLLDPALVRPGRADVHVEFDYATAEQAERMYEAFYEGGARLAADFGASAARRRLSMAQVQEALLVHRDSPEGALLAVCPEAVES